MAVVHDRPHFHISLMIDIVPYCDCHAENDVPMLPDIGMLASFDPVALDMACVDLANQAPVLPDSHLAEQPAAPDKDNFCHAHPDTDWRSCLEHAEKIGVGRRSYELITV